MDVRLPDGTIIQNVPDGTTKADLAAKLRTNGMNVPDEWMKPEPTMVDKAVQGAGNLAAGAVRGAGSIGATIVDAVQSKLAKPALDAVPPNMRPGVTSGLAKAPAGPEMRSGMDGGLRELGADPDSLMYQGGKLATEIAGTLPVGGVVGKGLQAAGATRLGTAVASAGFKTGAPAATTRVGQVADVATRAAGGAISGGASAALVDPSQAVTGALVGAASPGAIKVAERGLAAGGKAVRGAYRGAVAAVEPFTQSGRQAIAGRVLNKAAGADAPVVAGRLAQASEVVPGSVPTAAQVAENGGVAALERAVAARKPSEFGDRALEQSAARARAVEDIAGDAGKKELFGEARNSAAKDLYERAFSVPVEMSSLTPAMRGEVKKLMQIPAVQAGIKAARQNAANHGMKLDGDGSIAGLHQAKLAMDDMISELTGATGAQANKAKAIEAARNRVVSFMERMSPDYGEARATYAAMSKPVNQMDVGQTLLDKLRPALADSGALVRENGETFAKALRDPDGVVKHATGRNLRFQDVMEPDQIATLEAVARDLARKTNAGDLGRGVGSNTYQNFAQDNIAQQSGMPRLVGGLMDLPIVRKIPQMLYEKPEQEIQTAIARALLEPRTAATMMQQQIARQAQLSAARRPLLSDPTREIAELLFARSSPQILSGQ